MISQDSLWNRNFDVYDRLKKLNIDLGKKEDSISAPKGRRIVHSPLHHLD